MQNFSTLVLLTFFEKVMGWEGGIFYVIFFINIIIIFIFILILLLSLSFLFALIFTFKWFILCLLYKKF